MAVKRRNTSDKNTSDSSSKPPPNLFVFEGKKPPQKQEKTEEEKIQEAYDTQTLIQTIRRKELQEYKVKVTEEKLKNLSFTKVALAIIETDGFIMKAALKLGCSYKRISKIIKENPKLKDIITDCRESLLDLTENKLRDLILAGDRAAIIFNLKCRGRHRGWIEQDGATPTEEATPTQFVYDVVLPKNFKLVEEDKKKPEEKETKKEAVGE